MPSGLWIATRARIVRERAHHADADEQHRQDHCRHQPMEKPREQGELRLPCHGQEPFAVSVAISTALGDFGSPARRVNEVA